MVSVPCFPENFASLYCPTIAWGWNAGSTTATWWFLPYPGDVDFYSSVCLDQSTHHSVINFDMDTIRKVTTIFGTVGTSENQYDVTLYNNIKCASNEITQWIDGTNQISTITSVSNISLN